MMVGGQIKTDSDQKMAVNHRCPYCSFTVLGTSYSFVTIELRFSPVSALNLLRLRRQVHFYSGFHHQSSVHAAYPRFYAFYKLLYLLSLNKTCVTLTAHDVIQCFFVYPYYCNVLKFWIYNRKSRQKNQIAKQKFNIELHGAWGWHSTRRVAGNIFY